VTPKQPYAIPFIMPFMTYVRFDNTVYLVTKKLRMLELLAFDGFCRFDTSALF
jgi:hypothetical protein